MSSVVAAVGFDRIPIPGLLLGLEGTVLAANPAACVVFGLTAPELIQRPIGELIFGGERLTRATGEAHTLHLEVGGTRRTLQFVVSRLEVEDESVLQVYGLDITSISEAEAAARTRADAEQETAATLRLDSLGIVAGGIAHEFNNLLVGVLTESSAARDQDALPTETRDALHRIELAAERMAQLTRLMLAYAGRGRYLAARVDPDAVVAGLRESLVRKVGDRARLDIRGAGGGQVIEADVQMLRQVVLNMVANAAEADGSYVEVSTQIVLHKNAPWWQLEVRDDGIGIDARTMTRIFEPFFTTKPEHHGLGLSAVHGLVRRLGGDLDVDSTPGNGARFRVRVPVVPGAEASLRRTTGGMLPIAKLAGITVLVADDEPAVRSTVKRLLERRGAIVVTADDGAEAGARLHTHAYGLVILDVSMPKRTGYEVLEEARIVQPQVPVIVMSGYSHGERRDGSDAEPDAFLEKPFPATAMDAAIDRVMRRKRSIG